MNQVGPDYFYPPQTTLAMANAFSKFLSKAKKFASYLLQRKAFFSAIIDCAKLGLLLQPRQMLRWASQLTKNAGFRKSLVSTKGSM
jgi:hypothetical protein